MRRSVDTTFHDLKKLYFVGAKMPPFLLYGRASEKVKLETASATSLTDLLEVEVGVLALRLTPCSVCLACWFLMDG